jgi:RNA polymerase sigma-70 factor (ECF subfamily)
MTAASRTPPAPELLAQVYTAHAEAVYRFLHSRVGNRADAEDLTSEVFLKAVRGLEPRSAPSVQAWLFRIAHTVLADFWRARLGASTDELPEDIRDPRPLSRENSEAEARARSLLAAMPPRDAEVLRLRFLQRMSLQEAADKLGITLNHVKVLQYRALRRAARLEVQ